MLRRQARHDGRLRLVSAATEHATSIEPAERLRVVRALNTLSLDYRLVQIMHYIDGLTVPPSAEHLDRSVKSVEGFVKVDPEKHPGRLWPAAAGYDRGHTPGVA